MTDSNQLIYINKERIIARPIVPIVPIMPIEYIGKKNASVSSMICNKSRILYDKYQNKLPI